MVQWLRIRLSVQGTRIRPLAQEDPTRRGAMRPARRDHRARTLDPALWDEKLPPRKGCTPQRESRPLSPQLETARTQQWRPRQPKIKGNSQISLIKGGACQVSNSAVRLNLITASMKSLFWNTKRDFCYHPDRGNRLSPSSPPVSPCKKQIDVCGLIQTDVHILQNNAKGGRKPLRSRRSWAWKSGGEAEEMVKAREAAKFTKSQQKINSRKVMSLSYTCRNLQTIPRQLPAKGIREIRREKSSLRRT